MATVLRGRAVEIVLDPDSARLMGRIMSAAECMGQPITPRRALELALAMAVRAAATERPAAWG